MTAARLSRLALMVAVVSGAGAASGSFDSRARDAVRAGSLGGMQGVVRDAGKAIRESAAAPAALLADAISAFDRVEGGIDTLRARRESAVESDEAGLEKLYESDDWLRLDHLQGEVQYWRGWAHFRDAARKQGAGQDAAADYRAARRDFARAMRNIRDPAVARETLLATAIAERGAGAAAKSEATLERIETLFDEVPAEFKKRLRLERARTAQALGQRDAVLALTRDPDLRSAVGRDQADLRLRTLLAQGGEKPSLIRETARPMLKAGGDAAARAVVALEAAKLSSAELARLELGPEGDSLQGLALLREERFAEAADKLANAPASPGLREDIVLARLAEAQLRARRGAAAFSTCQRLRARFPKSALRPQIARFGYAAAQLWGAAEEGSPQAAEALDTASAWVIADAPSSEEAAEVRVRRAMAIAQRSGANRALRALDSLPEGAPGSDAVNLQKALLRSAKVQTALEASLRRSPGVRRHAAELDKALRKVPSSSPLATEHAADIAIAKARARLGLGRAGALELLRGLPPSLEVERTRIIGMWLLGDRRDALRATDALLQRGPGSPGERFRWALPIALGASEAGNVDPAALRGLLATLRAKAPADFDREFLLEIGLREARAAQRAGADRDAIQIAREVQANGPTTLSNLAMIAEIFEAAGEPGPATEVWHQISEVSDREGSAWLRARVGVARSLRDTPGRAQDGCDVAMSLVVSGRSFPTDVEDELRAIAGSCDVSQPSRPTRAPTGARPSGLPRLSAPAPTGEAHWSWRPTSTSSTTKVMPSALTRTWSWACAPIGPST